MRLEKMSVTPNLRSAGNTPLTRPSGTLSPLERAVIKEEILSPRPHRGRGAGGEGAVVAAAHNLGFKRRSKFSWRGQIFIGFSGAFSSLEVNEVKDRNGHALKELTAKTPRTRRRGKKRRVALDSSEHQMIAERIGINHRERDWLSP